MNKIKTVIADDLDPILKYLEKVLSDTQEYEIIGKATNGKKLIQIAEKEKPELIISDEQMPECSGTEAIKQLIEKNIKSKYILITGHDDPEINVQAKKLGIAKVIIKPILDDKKFVEQVREALHIDNDTDNTEQNETEKIIRYDEINEKKDSVFKKLLKLLFRKRK